jgi:hypothetical protein
LARGEADFERQAGPLSVTFVDDLVSALPTGVAKSGIDQIQAKLSSCTTFTSTSSGDTINFRIAPLSFPRVGDQTLALRLTGQPQSGVLRNASIPVDTIIIRVGNNVAVLINGGLNAVDSSLTESLARKQASKLATL